VAVVALGLLGFYSFTSPHTRVTAVSTPAPPSAAASASTASSAGLNLPPLASGGVSAAPAPGAPVRVPVTVLNSTAVRGLAADVAGAIKSGGWATNPVGAYAGRDVSASTVYFSQNDEVQRQAAVQLVAQFPQLHGPVARFFEVPNSPSPGLVVVVTGDWKP
jgi:hypothetical protein